MGPTENRFSSVLEAVSRVSGSPFSTILAPTFNISPSGGALIHSDASGHVRTLTDSFHDGHRCAWRPSSAACPPPAASCRCHRGARCRRGCRRRPRTLLLRRAPVVTSRLARAPLPCGATSCRKVAPFTAGLKLQASNLASFGTERLWLRLTRCVCARAHRCAC